MAWNEEQTRHVPSETTPRDPVRTFAGRSRATAAMVAIANRCASTSVAAHAWSAGCGAKPVTAIRTASNCGASSGTISSANWRTASTAGDGINKHFLLINKDLFFGVEWKSNTGRSRGGRDGENDTTDTKPPLSFEIKHVLIGLHTQQPRKECVAKKQADAKR